MENASKWVQIGPDGPNIKLKLFCFHHAGGSANFFQNWQSQLPDFVQVCSVQLPGRWDRVHEKPFVEMHGLVKVLRQVLQPLFVKPFAVLGYSFGARIAFELLRSLRRHQESLPLLFFSLASVAPATYKGLIRHRLSDEALIENIAKDYGPFPEIILQDDELRRLMLGVLKADVELLETYKYEDEPPFDFPIVALGGIADRMVEPEGLADWRRQTTHDFSMRIYEGGHFFAESLPESVLECLTYQLNRYAGKIK